MRSRTPDEADPASERVLLNVDQPFANHNGGGVVFGNDGMLYIAFGDGGSASDPMATARTSARCWARSCASTSADRRRNAVHRPS